MAHTAKAGWMVVAVTLGLGCGGQASGPGAKVAVDSDAPEWIERVELSRERLCGVGIAGAGFDENSPYPRQLSQERAIRNLAGILGTSIQEAIIDRETNSGIGVELARHLQVDEALVQKVTELAETEYWLDRRGVGPFAQKNFVYAHTCIDTAKAAASFKVDPKALVTNAKPSAPNPETVPAWVQSFGKQSDGRVCAVGFSLPMFHPDKTFESVVEDVRGQLALVIETLVSSYHEEITNQDQTAYELMTVATTQALAKGVIVTDFWYDKDGIGPNGKTRSTYGHGCAYPMDIVAASLAVVEDKLPEDEQTKIARVRERAQSAFEALDGEIAKREPAPAPGPTDGVP